MGCIVTHKGKEYTEEEFKKLLLSDSSLYNEMLNRFKNNFKSILNLLSNKPELAEIGTIFDLQKYVNLNSISNLESITAEDFNSWMHGESESVDFIMKTFSDADKYTIMQEMMSRLFSTLDIQSSLTLDSLYSSANKIFDEIAQELLDKNLTQEHTFLMENKDDILGNGIYEDSIKEYINAELGITEDEDVLDLTGENIKDVGQASYEIDIAKALSAKVKIMFSAIKDSTANPGFGNFIDNLSGKDALDAIQQVLAEAKENSMDEVRRIIEAKVELNPNDLNFYKDILNVLEQIEVSNPDMLNQILYNLYQAKVQMRFIMWKRQENGSLVIENYDANVKNPLFIKRNNWTESLKNNGLIDQYESYFYKINERVYNEVNRLHNSIFEAYNKNKNIANVNVKDLKNLLKYYGITLNEKTYENMYDNQTQNDFDLTSKLFDSKKSILNIIKDNVDRAFNSKDKLTLSPGNLGNSSEVVKALNPLTSSNSQINDLIQADNFVEFIPMGTMYLAGKTINMYQQPNPITNKANNIRKGLAEWTNILEDSSIPEDQKNLRMPKVLQDFLNTSITSNSMLLDLMLNNPSEASKYFDTVLASLETLKENGTKSRDDMGITDLSDKDSLTTLLGFFSSSEGQFISDEFNEKYDNQIKLRKGSINFPTLSDSSQMPILKTILIELSTDNVDLENDTLDTHTLSILRDQLLFSDLFRIADYLKNAPEGVNIDGYDVGATWITNMSSLNTVLVDTGKFDEKNVPIKKALKTAFAEYILSNVEENSTEENIRAFVEKNQEVIDNNITENILHEVNKLVSKDGTKGDFVEFELIDKKGKIKLSDGKPEGYFNKKPARLVAYDYVINNLIQQKEIQTLFAGDLAYYFKNKMGGNLVNGLPRVNFNDVVNQLYPSQAASIFSFLGSSTIEDLSTSKKAELLENYPDLKYAPELISADISHIEQYENLLPIYQSKINKTFKDVQNNLSKRLKGQLSPGSQFANISDNIKDTYQVVLSDVESASETIVDMIQRTYPELAKDVSFMQEVKQFKNLDEKNFLEPEEIKQKDTLYKNISKKIPTISAYLKTASTDAQEYTSWKNNLDQLLYQGRINSLEYEKIKSKLEAQAKELDETGNIKPENRLTRDEMKVALMQPSKPLYSGLTTQKVGQGHNIQRYTYVKSSSFPIIPELGLMFPKLNNMRKVMERIEETQDKTVRVAYESAVKVGGPKNKISSADMQKERSLEEIDNFIESKVQASSIVLDKNNFYIQQDKPFKSDKNAEKGKSDRTVRATQMEKIILGDGITKMGEIFPSQIFDENLLKDLNIEPNSDSLINGQALQNIYNELYKREQKILSDKLFNQLGIDSYQDMSEGKPEVMEKLVNILNKRLTNKQDKKALELLYQVTKKDENGNTYKDFISKQDLKNNKDLVADKAIFKFPLMMTPNSRKFESVLNSVVNKNNVNLQLPGFSFPIASQEGFDYRGYEKEALEDLTKKGLILSPDFDPTIGLQSERDSSTGQLKYAQVFMASKYKVYNKETGKYDYINMQDYVNPETNRLDYSKIPKDLLSMFSFRIPTSRHQSGTIIEVAGFLPHTMGDLMIVPKDHTVQIGEDYDIDVRYAYQYNYFKTEDGNLKKMDYSDLAFRPDKTMSEYKTEYNNALNEAWNSYYRVENNLDNSLESDQNKYSVQIKNPYLESNKEKIMESVILQDIIDNNLIDNMVKAIFKDQYEVDSVDIPAIKRRLLEIDKELFSSQEISDKNNELVQEYKKIKESLKEKYKEEKSTLRESWNNYYKAYDNKIDEQKIIENNIVSLYKSVFGTANTEVRNMITSVLSTDFSEQSAEAIDEKLSMQEPFFNIYSPSTQRKVMKLGADGKMGIGVHSNAVTLTSLLQQLKEPIQIASYVTDEGNIIPFDIKLGNMVFTGKLGDITDKVGRRISEYISESQNSSTDNQKLEIMGRRNENSETISVFSLLQITGHDNDGLMVNGKEISYASLFISQPVMLQYVKLVKQLKSSTVESFSNPTNKAIKVLKESLIKNIDPSNWDKDSKGKAIIGVLKKSVVDNVGENLTSENLYENIGPAETYTNNALQQYRILEIFETLKGPASSLKKLQSFINIENGGMGISYFDTIDLLNSFDDLSDLNFVTQADAKKGKVSSNAIQSIFGKTEYVEKGSQPSNTSAVFLKSDRGMDLYITPSTHYSHKIMNSISLGYNLWNNLFPYDSPVYASQMRTILGIAGFNQGTERARELQYDVMSSMKDFSYTSSRTLFGSNFESTRQDLFFDDKENNKESLGGYLLRLKNDPSMKEFFKRPFFKELQINIEDKTHPTIIKYVSGDMSVINNLKMYNLLEKMSNSNVELPAKKDGTLMTEKELMKQLLMYSIIADQGNGAIGFRHLLPMSLFEKYQLDTILRNRNDVNSPDMTSLIYNGPVNYMTNLFGRDINSEGIIELGSSYSLEEKSKIVRKVNMYALRTANLQEAFSLDSNTGNIIYNYFNGQDTSNDFVRQYFQHNPDKVGNKVVFSDNKNSNYQKILSQNNAFNSDLNSGTFTSFTLRTTPEDTTIFPSTFMTITNSLGETFLYEKYSTERDVHNENISYYKQIPKLGIFGYNEYQINKNVNISTVKPNNVRYSNLRKAPINLQSTIELIQDGNLSDIVSSMVENYDGPYNNLLGLIENFMPNLNSVDVQIVSGLRGSASYTPGKADSNGEYIQPVISLSEETLKNRNMNQRDFQNLIIEELLHHVTVSTINDYVSFGGLDTEGELIYTFKDNVEIPPALNTLVHVYKDAIKHYSNKYGKDILLSAINDITSTVSSTQDNVVAEEGLGETAYRLKDIHEFIAGIFIKDSAFAKEMANTKYLNSNKSILQKFSETLARFFQKILPNNRKDTFSAEVANSLTDFLDFNNAANQNNKLLDSFTFPGLENIQEIKNEIEKEENIPSVNTNKKENIKEEDILNIKLPGSEVFRLRNISDGTFDYSYGVDISNKFNSNLTQLEYIIVQNSETKYFEVYEKNSGMLLLSKETSKEALLKSKEFINEVNNKEENPRGFDNYIMGFSSVYGMKVENVEDDIEQDSPDTRKATETSDQRKSINDIFSPLINISLSDTVNKVDFKC